MGTSDGSGSNGPDGRTPPGRSGGPAGGGPAEDAPVAPHERRWPATLAVLVILAMQVSLPDAVRFGPTWLLPVIEVALLAPVVAANPVGLTRDSGVLRRLALGLAVLLILANAAHLVALAGVLVAGTTIAPVVLVQAAALIWVTNVVATALALWEVDRDGPFARDPRHPRTRGRPDLLFPQMTGVPGWDAATWHPAFTDYLFVAFTTATAFSPTDTLPLSARAKLVSAASSGVALLTIAVIAARAVNVL